MEEIHVNKEKVIEILGKMTPGDGIVIHKNNERNKPYSIAVDDNFAKTLNLTKDDYSRKTVESETDEYRLR